MTNDLPLRFDPVLFAKRGRQLAGKIAVRDLPRVMELAPNSDSEISVTMSFSTSSLQFPMVKGTIEGEVVQSCQRCLGDATVKIDGQFELLLVNPFRQLQVIPNCRSRLGLIHGVKMNTRGIIG